MAVLDNTKEFINYFKGDLMSNIFNEKMQDLDILFKKMGNMVSRTIDKAVMSFIAHDEKTSREIINRDHEINDREAKIEKRTFEMIALYRPVSTDLREVVTILKAVSILERMGDHARDIAQSTIRIHNRKQSDKRIPKIERKISEMGFMATKTVDRSLDAYVSDSVDQVSKILKMYKEVSELSSSIRENVLIYMRDNPNMIDTGGDYLYVIGFLKRTADQATDIIEWLVYKHNGKIIDLNPGSSSFVD